MRDEIPVNVKTLAARIGRTPFYVHAMKAGGYAFSHGNRTLAKHALKWLRENPSFRSTAYGRQRAESLVPRTRPRHLQPVTVDMCGELAR